MSELSRGTTPSLPRLELCTFTLAVALGAVLLLPFSIISNEVLLSLPRNYYIQWLNGSLIHCALILVAAEGGDGEQIGSGRHSLGLVSHRSPYPFHFPLSHGQSLVGWGVPLNDHLCFSFFCTRPLEPCFSLFQLVPHLPHALCILLH